MFEPAVETRLDRRQAALHLAGWALLPGCTAGPADARATDPWQRWASGEWRGFTTDNIPKLSFAALDALRATGARLARVGVRIDPGCSSCPPGGVAPHNLQSLQRVLDHAQRIGVGVVVLGDFDGGSDNVALWQEAALQDRFVQTWGAMARELGPHPAIAGLDLLNEPNPPWTDGSLASAQAPWRTLAQRTVAEIRRAGCDRPIVFEPVAGGSALGLRGLQPLDDPRVVYSLHFYTPHTITHQQVSRTWPQRIPYPAGAEWQLGGWDPELGTGPIDAARLAAELRHARDFQRRHAKPLYVGEFGCVRWAPQGSALRWVRDSVNLFNSYGWSWSFHSFRTWPGWDAEIASEEPAARQRSTDAPVMQLLRHALVAPNTHRTGK